MASSGPYDLGDVVELTASFATSSGAANPTAVRFRVLKPAIIDNQWIPGATGILTTYTTGSTAITNPAVGSYVCAFQIDRADRYGYSTWWYSAESSGQAVGGGSTSFLVNPWRLSS